MMSDAVDLVLPLYRPRGEWAERIAESIRALKNSDAMKECVLTVFVVNDGSDPGLFPEEKLELIGKEADSFEFLSYQRNRGKGYSLRFGVAAAHGDYQIYTDGDFPFSEQGVIDAYLALKQGSDVVMGTRGSDYATALPPIRKMLSRNVKRMNRMLLKLPMEYIDTQAGLKGFNRRGRVVFLNTRVETFLFDTEFILLAWRNRLKIGTIPLSLRPGLHFSKMGLKVMLRELRHFAVILMQQHFSARRKPKKKGCEESLY
ncbi:MAG: glycosyltransferase [Victivallaceae bacterium]|nr:glycosyltransferase [Victivallaceae bacterium]